VDLTEAIYGRRAVREFSTAPVGEEALRRLIDTAIQAPSAVNEQPWAFTVVRDQPLLDTISRESKAHMLAGPPPTGSLPARVTALLTDLDFHIFYHAPVLILISANALGDWAVEDCSLAAANLMLAAHADGLGTCWIGFAQRWLRTPAGRASLDIPASHMPVAPIIVGHPKAPSPPVARKPADIRWIG
jgi:nitroreductase